MKPPAFQLYAADFYMDTGGWTVEEVGIYFRLLMHQWVNGELPNDPRRLSSIAQCSYKKFQFGWEIIQKKFIQNEKGFLINSRLEKTRQEQEEYLKKVIESGRLGGLKTQEKRRQPSSDPSSDPSSERPSENEALQSSSSSSSSLKESKYIGDAPKKPEPSPDPNVAIFFNHAFTTFERTYSEKLMIDGKKDGDLVKKLLRTYGLERLKGLWDVFMQSDDPFIRQAGKSIGVFKSQINKLISGGNGTGKVSASSQGILSWAERKRREMEVQHDQE